MKSALLAALGAVDRVARVSMRRHELPRQQRLVFDHQDSQGLDLNPG